MGRADSPAEGGRFVEARTGKGSHRRLINPKTGRIITIAVHTKKEVGTGLAAKILKEAGL